MIYKNLEVLKKKSIPLYNLFRNLKVESRDLFDYDLNKNDVDIYLKNTNKIYISSLTHKAIEAELLVNDVLSGDYDEIIVLGVGNNVFFEKLLNRIDSDRKLHIIEFGEVIDIIFRNVDIKKNDFSKINELICIDKNFDLTNLFSKVMKKTNMKIKFFVLPQYKRLFKTEIQELEDKLLTIMEHKKTTMNTNQGYQKLWIFNSILNFKHVLSTPSFMKLKEHDFSKAIAIVVGAGPSLARDMELIKKISKKNNCFIFAIGSAYKALIKNDVSVDALFSYDPTHLNEDVLMEYYEQECDIPIVFGSSISFEAIRKVDYNKAFHLLTSQDYFSAYLLEGEDKSIVMDAPSVVVIALQALVKIGFKGIVLSGQNLAYLNDENYSEGIDYKRLEGTTYKSEIKIKDVFGQDISTTSGYKLTLDVLENFILANKNIEFINTTNGGAQIEGAPYKSLDKLELEHYEKNESLMEMSLENDYNLLSTKVQFDLLIDERNKFVVLLNKGFKLVYDVKQNLEDKTVKDLKLLAALGENYNAMAENIYFKVLISKLDRTYINIFESNVVAVNRENDLYKKYEMIYSKMGTLYSLFKRDDRDVNKLFEYISKYIKWE